MINILIIFLTQYFQQKISDIMVRISPFNQGYGVQSFSQMFFSSMDERDENMKDMKATK
jgi:hypothetical protein